MGLDENAVDLLEIDGADLVAHGFEQAAQAEVAGAAQQALAGAHDQRERFRGEGVVAQAGSGPARARMNASMASGASRGSTTE